MSKQRLLIAYAHPDDESFGLGAVIAYYVERGVEVSLICATNGDRGTVNPEMLNGYDSVAALRLAELDCAAKTLGLAHVYTFGYRDSGMMGSPTCSDPECLWQAPVDAVTRRVVEVIREIKPHVVITFNRYGGYGHPDHIAIQRATAGAFTLASDAHYNTGQTPYAPQKLYYSSIPKRQLQLGITMMRLRGHDPRRLGKNRDIDLVAILENAEPVHTLVDVRHYHRAWEEANSCHKSQLGGAPSWRLPMSLRRWFTPTQGFTRIYPEPRTNRVDERDLFAGVQVDESLSSAAD